MQQHAIRSFIRMTSELRNVNFELTSYSYQQNYQIVALNIPTAP